MLTDNSSSSDKLSFISIGYRFVDNYTDLDDNRFKHLQRREWGLERKTSRNHPVHKPVHLFWCCSCDLCYALILAHGKEERPLGEKHSWRCNIDGLQYSFISSLFNWENSVGIAQSCFLIIPHEVKPFIKVCATI